MRLPLVGQIRRGWQITSAFTWMGYIGEVAYPLNFAVRHIQPLFNVIVYYFLARLVVSGPDVAFDYYSFIIIGSITVRLMDSGLAAFANTLELAVEQGRFETLLVEPIRWKLVPFGMASWPLVMSTFTAGVMGVCALGLGLHIAIEGIPVAIAITVLAIGASHALGILASALKILSKRGNPFISLYGMAATLLSGVLFPVETLPSVIRPISYMLPSTHAIQAMRRSLMPQGDVLAGPSTLASLLALTLFCAVVYPLALWAYTRTVDVGRRYGTLAGY